MCNSYIALRLHALQPKSANGSCVLERPDPVIANAGYKGGAGHGPTSASNALCGTDC